MVTFYCLVVIIGKGEGNMIDLLKKKSKKSILIRCVISLLIVIGCLAYCGMGLIQWIKGPKSLKNVEDISEYEGKYVSFEVEYIMDAYLWTTSKNTDTNVETTTAMAYVVYNYDMDTCFGFEVKTSDDTIYDDFINDTWNALYYGETAPESFVIKGTLKPITDVGLTYFNSTVNEIFSEEYKDDIYPYYIDTATIDGKGNLSILLATGAAILALLYCLSNLIKANSNSYMKYLNQYLAVHSDISLANIEADFNSAEQVRNVWIGLRWTIYMEGIHARIINNENLVWAYYYQRTGKRPESKIITYDINKNSVAINVSSADADTILHNWSIHQPHMILGYDRDMEKVFKKEFDTFLNYKYNKINSDPYNQTSNYESAAGNEFYNSES